MLNNDILRSVRYMLDLADNHLVQIAALGGLELTAEQVHGMLEKDDAPGFVPCNDRRGRDESQPPRPVEKRITNNLVLKKLRVAFELKDQDIIDILASVDFAVSKAELNALFRQPGHNNYRPCGDQLLRLFLKGLTSSLRG